MQEKKLLALLTDCDGVLVSWYSKIKDFLISKGLPHEHLEQIFSQNRFYSPEELFPFGDKRSWELLDEYNNSQFIAELDIVEKASVEALQRISERLKIVVVTNLSSRESARDTRFKMLKVIFGDIFDDVICLAPFSDKTTTLISLTMRYQVLMWVDDNARHVKEGQLAGISESIQYTGAGVIPDPTCHVESSWLNIESILMSKYDSIILEEANKELENAMATTKKPSSVEVSEALEEIQLQIEDSDSWKNCFFHREKSELLHDEGICPACDYKRYLTTITKKQLENLDFIESWEWGDIWKRRYEKQ